MTTDSVPETIADRLIGVIDLKAGQAVHAIAGQRSTYQPVRADGVPDGDALQLAMRYRQLGIHSLYIADLDAIVTDQPNTELLSELTSISEQCFIDVGPSANKLVDRLDVRSQLRVVLPTESFASLEAWTRACTAIGPERVVLGIDLEGVQLRSADSMRMSSDQLTITDTTFARDASTLWRNVSAWVEQAEAMSIAGLLVLDLRYVGTSHGPGCAKSCQMINVRRRNQRLSLISGGGVRCYHDAITFLQAGCHQVLVGTALHADESARKLLHAIGKDRFIKRDIL